MAEPTPEKPKPSPERYERLLRGEITPKQYVKSLREQARSSRPSRSGSRTSKNGRAAS